MRLRIVHKRQAGSFGKPDGGHPPSTPDEFSNIKRWQLRVPFEHDQKGIITVPDDAVKEVARDYLNVTIKGYLSTFQGTTPSDRQGDYVEPGAFTDTLKGAFSDNPVMLRDHTNETSHLVGSFYAAKEDNRGLYIEGQLSNAPDVRSVRFKVAEGHLKTLSMGGVFHYKEDGRGIFKVDLWEGSLTPIPANPDAVFTTRSLNDLERKFLKSQKYKSFYDFLKAETGTRNHAELAA